MLFHSSIRQELARSFSATLVVLATVVMTMMLIRTLGQASRGSFSPSDVMLVMGYTMLAYMPIILSISLFISIIATLSRMYRDSEMVIWFSSGQSLSSWLNPLFRFAWPIWLVIMALALLVLPWSNQQIGSMKDQYAKRGDIDRIEPGLFQESASGKRVFFVEKDSTGLQSGNNVLIVTNENGKETITSARSGRVQRVEEGQFLMLGQGQRLESEIGKSDLKISEFEEYGIKVGVDLPNSSSSVPVKNRPTQELLTNQTLPNQAELSWRLGLILASINLVLLGITVSSGNPRVGRSANFVLALFIFVVYYNLLGLGQSWIGSGRVDFGQWLLTLHGGVLMLGVLWLAKRHNNWQLRGAMRARSALLRKPST